MRAGSSPHVRGTPLAREVQVVEPRFIPARAGNAAVRRPRRRRGPVHPRTCGERAHVARRQPQPGGSSPHVRGTPERRDADYRGRRFIPARAGNARRGASRGSGSPVHPRTCGERSPVVALRIATAGSSPHVRGTPERGRGRALPRQVHPRTCGERCRLIAVDAWYVGSSPHVRGTRVREQWHRDARRFIPARAGNARARSRCGARAPVHPRTCGERAAAAALSATTAGSSPHVRGTPQDHLPLPLPQRFIPARAGNAAIGSSWPISRSVHPRTCGERSSVQHNTYQPVTSLVKQLPP